MGGGPLGIAYGLRVPRQELVPAPRVGLNHADPEDRSGRAVYPSWGVPAVTAVFPAQRQRPHHVFCVRFVRFGLRFGPHKMRSKTVFTA